MVVDDEQVTVAMPWVGWKVMSWVLEHTQTNAIEGSDDPNAEEIAETADKITALGASQLRTAGTPDPGADPATEVRLSLVRTQWTFVLAELADFISRTGAGDINEEAAEIARATAALIAPAIAASGS